MKSSEAEILPIIGTLIPKAGGYYSGRFRIADQVFALFSAPKAEGETRGVWIPRGKSVPGALSYFDGMANTKAMAAAGSKLAQWALDLRVGGFDDWYLCSQDEEEVRYRNLKPGTTENWCYARSGINLSAVPPTYPYTPDFPVQTLAEAFQAGGDQAFEQQAYWTSTQPAAISGYAWCQTFYDGTQYDHRKDNELVARAVRRLPIEQLIHFL